MIDYEYTQQLGEEISAVKIKAKFNGLNIEAEIDAVRDKIEELHGGSDKVVWIPESNPNVILKLAEGSQIKQIPVAFKDLFVPFFEYILPKPVEWRDVIFYRIQVQTLLQLPEGESHTYYPNNKIKIHCGHKAINRDFLWSLMETRGEDFIIDLAGWQMETGVSSTNWGLDNGKPKIFDYGSVKNEKWREIAMIRDGFYFEDGVIVGGDDGNNPRLGRDLK